LKGKAVRPPGPKAPDWMQSGEWMFRPIQFMERCRRRHGSIFRIKLGTDDDIVVIGDPNHAMDVLSGDPEVFDSWQANPLLRPALGGNSLLVLDGEEHMDHRRILLPSFKAGHVKTYSEAIERAVRSRISQWPVGERMRLYPEMQAITFDVISRVVLGLPMEERTERLAVLAGDVSDRAASAFTLLPPLQGDLAGLSPYARLMRVVAEIDELLFSIIRERRDDPLHTIREDVLSTLLRAEHMDGSPLGLREIRDELLTMIMMGIETTAAGLSWAFERVLRTPRVIETLRFELEYGDDRYLDGVIKEVLRVRPAVPIVARQVNAPVELAGYEFPEGTVLLASVLLVHTDPTVYPDPDEFLPERFTAGGVDLRAWIPFGGGLRRCLGGALAELEMKLVLRTVLSEFDLAPARPAPESAERRRFTFAPKDDCEAIVRSRLPATEHPAHRRGARTAV